MERYRLPRQKRPRRPCRCLAHRARPRTLLRRAPARLLAHGPGLGLLAGSRLCRRQPVQPPLGARGAPRPARAGVGAAIDAAMPTVSGRAKVLLLVFAAIAAVFFLRLVFLQVIVSDQYSAMAEESRTVSFETTPRRGTIYDRNGIVLATSVEATTIYANPVEVTDAAAEAASLASVLGGDAADYRELLSTPSTTFVYIKRQADVDVADKVKELKLDGVYFIADTRREYPNGAIGGQVIGYCNVDGEGITGLELQYNDILSGTPGTYTAERGEQGFPIPGGVKEETPAVNGQDIMVSLDIKLQDTVEQALAEGVKDLETEEGSSIVMDAATGEIYAACSLPYMNPADMSSSQVGSESVKAITQAYEPGSTFKSVSALTILEQGTMGPEDTMFCPSSISADDYDVSDSHERDGETYSLREILNHSSNVGISLATEQAGFDKLYDNIKRFHFTESTGVDYPGEAAGNVLDFDNWAKITGYNVSFRPGHRGDAAADGALLQRHRQRWDARDPALPHLEAPERGRGRMGKRGDGRRRNGARRYALDAALGGHRRHGSRRRHRGLRGLRQDVHSGNRLGRGRIQEGSLQHRLLRLH